MAILSAVGRLTAPVTRRIMILDELDSTSPYLRASVWMDVPKLPDRARALWATAQMTIEGPPGTDPYGDGPCSADFLPLDSTDGPACVRVDETDSLSHPVAGEEPEFRCERGPDCAEGYICVDARGYGLRCVLGYLRQ